MAVENVCCLLKPLRLVFVANIFWKLDYVAYKLLLINHTACIQDAVEKDQLCICLLLYLAIHSCMYQRRLRVQYVLYIYRYIEEHVQRTGVAIETQGFSFVTSGRRRESLTVHMSYLCF